MFPVPEFVPGTKAEIQVFMTDSEQKNRNFYIAQKIGVFKRFHRRVCE